MIGFLLGGFFVAGAIWTEVNNKGCAQIWLGKSGVVCKAGK